MCVPAGMHQCRPQAACWVSKQGAGTGRTPPPLAPRLGNAALVELQPLQAAQAALKSQYSLLASNAGRLRRCIPNCMGRQAPSGAHEALHACKIAHVSDTQ